LDLLNNIFEILRLIDGSNLNIKVETKLPIDKKSNERRTTSNKLTWEIKELLFEKLYILLNLLFSCYVETK
tara:strand:+ start:217 stop:429 length:213 start_codon:yes stop_codon:yes gene_type:complete